MSAKSTKSTRNARGWRQFKVEEVAAALEKSRGLVSFAARLLGCNRTTIYNYFERYPQLRDIIHDAGEALVDKAELKLEKAIDNDEPWAIALVLKTKGKSRGYVERVEFVDWRAELEKTGVKASDVFEQLVSSIAEKMTNE